MENGEIQLQQFLQNLCTDSPWSYAIFWKLHQQHIFLTCEDGYFDYSRLQGSAQSILDDGYTRQENASNYIPVTNLSDEQSLGHSIRVAIADMSCHRYEHGEGTVGMVAASGSDLWIYFDDKKSVEFLSTPKYPDEWHLATTVGIKTTLLAPVMPHGVLQLGSLKKVAQNPELVGTIIDRFNCDFSSSFTFDKNTLPSSSSQMKDSMFNTWLKHDYFGGNLTTDTGGEEFSYGNEVLASSILDNFLHMQDNPTVSPFEYDIDLSYMYQDLDSESTVFTEFLMDDIVENPEEGCSNDRVSGESFSGNYDYLFHDETQVVPTFDMDHGEDCINLEYLDDFLKGFEVSEAFEEAFEIINRRDSKYSNDQTMDFGQESDQEHILEALITELYDSSYDIVSYNSYNNSYMSSLTSPIHNSTNQKRASCDATTALTIDDGSLVNEASNTESLDQSTVDTCHTSPPSFESVVGALPKDKHVAESGHEASNTESLDQSTVDTSLTSPPSFESLVGSLPKDNKREAESGHGLSDTSAKELKVGKRKTKAKSCHRQRPRDRQLMQNRLKELRELVPNVEQCSIDGLLERTIEHMTFLTSIEEQADKLKEFNAKLITSKKEKTTTEHCCATSSALKVEQSTTSCPVIVKELEHPGQLHIQMLCDDQTAFFEMAEVIHRLKLTVLKGVMESCCSNWAHFVVQASIGFNRLDIFWPLMKILQRNGNWTI